jgi:hypothetical protein
VETGFWNILDRIPRRGVEEEDDVETLDIVRVFFSMQDLVDTLAWLHSPRVLST